MNAGICLVLKTMARFCLRLLLQKKNLPRAVDRNKIKRRIRVALHKEKDLLVDSGFNRFLFIYLKEEVLSFGVVQKELAKLIRSL